jgi:23S rRNA (cytosine1962-C5)-methyltransferase
VLPCLIFEDEHLLVVNKPAGLNTHAPSPYAGEGLYDWLRHRDARWARLAIIHRLDKETSGVMVFAKTPVANRSLTAQFTARSVCKRYLLLTDRPVRESPLTVRGALVRAGERYVSRPVHSGGETAETVFREGRRENAEYRSGDWCQEVEAEPLTGRTHQIRVHAAESGFPILGDILYGGTAAPRVYLHAAELRLKHPASGEELTFRAPTGPDWAGILLSGYPEHGRDAFHRVPIPYKEGRGGTRPYHTGTEVHAEGHEARGGPACPLPCLALREALIEPHSTNAYRLIHGASDGWPGWYVERLGDYLLSQSAHALSPGQREELARLVKVFLARGVYHKVLTRQVRRVAQAEASPQPVLGEAAPERFMVRENGLQFELGFTEGYSTGLFLDQRDNRRRLLTRHVASGFPLLPTAIGNSQWELLNLFAYTCGFSVCAAKAGARTTSLDLSRRWLDWGKHNFAPNQLEPDQHEFIYGEAFDWLRRLARKGRRFDVILLDPPTFSQSRESGVFQAEKDYSRLVAAALPLLKTGGVLFASTNTADWTHGKFLAAVDKAIHSAGRRVLQRHYVPQPPDFPVSRAEPAYLKTEWLRVT